MSVLVISVIMVAMAPVITKRVSDNLNISGTSSTGITFEGRLFTASAFNDMCNEDYTNNHVICNFEVPRGVNSINAIVVSGGGGGGGGAYGYTGSPVTKSSNDGNSLISVDITPGLKNVHVSLSGASGSGGAGIFQVLKDVAPKKADCDALNAVFIQTDSTNATGFCMTKNVGETNGPSLTVTPSDPSSSYYYEGGDICFSGTTASSYTSGYSNKTLCRKNAAVDICKTYEPGLTLPGEWTLPTQEMLTTYASAIIAKKSSLGLCSNNKSYSPYCLDDKTRCRYREQNGSELYGTCYPSRLLTSSYYFYTFNGTGFTSVSGDSYSAGRVHCVLTNISKKIAGAQGGAGGGAPAIFNYILPQEHIKTHIGGVLRAASAKGYKTAALSTAAGVQGEDGSYTYKGYAYDDRPTPSHINWFDDETEFLAQNYRFSFVGLYSPDDILKGEDPTFAIAMDNGSGGQAASCTATGCIGGKGGRSSDFDDNWNNSAFSCVRDNYWSSGNYCPPGIVAQHGTAGRDGVVFDDLYNTPQVDVKREALRSNAPGTTLKLSHNTYFLLDGYDMLSQVSYDVGGSLGSVPYVEVQSDGTPKIKALENYSSSGGQAIVTYFLTNPSSGGSGGGAGKMFELTNLPVTPLSTIQIFVGKGGLGGAAGTRGTYASGSSGNSASYTASYHYGKRGANGGKSGIKVSDSIYAYVNGGQGGYGGYYTTSATSAPSYGTVGAKGTHSTAGISAEDIKYKEGENGSSAKNQKTTYSSVEYVTSSWGGMGGKSPTGAFGGCGGLFTYPNANDTANQDLFVHVNSNPNCRNTNIKGQKTEVLIPNNFINAYDYGSAGAGGGGGGWDYDHWDAPGAGGDGQPGYVYVWWVKPN